MLRFRYVPDGNSQRSRSEERVRSSSSLSGGQQNVPHSPPRCAASTRPAPRVKANVIVSRRTSEKVRDVLHPQEFVRRRDSSSPVKSEQGTSAVQHVSLHTHARTHSNTHGSAFYSLALAVMPVNETWLKWDTVRGQRRPRCLKTSMNKSPSFMNTKQAGQEGVRLPKGNMWEACGSLSCPRKSH